MFSKNLPRILPALLILSLTSPQASGKPLPPETGNPSSKLEARSSTDGGLQTWEIILIVLGAVFGIMLVGGLGGACEVLLHTRGKIVQSNAEADAKVEAGGHRAYIEEDTGSDALTEVEEVDPSRFSWQPEKMTTGEGLREDRALSETDTNGSSQTTLNGEQGSVNGTEEVMHDVDLDWDMPVAGSSDTEVSHGHTRDRGQAWDDQTYPDPALSQFIIDDEEGPEYEEEGAAGYDRHEDHFTEPVAMPNEGDYQQSNLGTAYGHQEDREHIGEALVVAPVGDYSGGGYSPAANPDDVDYLAEYRQSQIYLQQDDDWQQYYGSSHNPSGTDQEQEGHHTQEGKVPQPDPGYF
ncbi:hypothetical protein VSDG_03614 [Cytospora chrysosperma]|uniref:Uncharacterized protein n=1 Tax=Cytospora chrysosperma TaxID=252740 RepID=A0A423W9U3_CYTCH|nr:hypothetical protein VSDG_03614 [Valsa sordida]